jgi:hypothetical protein
MATTHATTSGANDIATFQGVVQQQEGIFGPLTNLRADGPNNVMTFEVGPSPPTAKRAVLEVYAGHPPNKVGHALICVANCMVSGALKDVAAYRPN